MTDLPADLQQTLVQAYEAHRAGRLTEAEKGYRQVTAAAPDHDECRYLLGIVLSQKGDWPAAEQELRRAHELMPDNPERLSNLGTTIHRQGRAAEAVPLFEQAAALDPSFMVARANLAAALLDAGRAEDALEACAGVKLAEPGHAPIYMTEGNVCTELNRLDDAETAYRRFMDLAPNNPRGPAALGQVLTAVGRLDAAEEVLRRAVTAHPDSAPLHQSLGSLLARQGHTADSVRHLQKSVDLDPNLTLAYFELSESGQAPFDAATIAHLEKLIADPSVRDVDKVRLNFALATQFNREKFYTRAIPAIRAANQERKALAARAGHTYDRGRAEDRAAAIKAYFTADKIAHLQRRGSGSETPVFAVGMPRSGTTLVERIIASHSRAAAAGEVRWMEQTVCRLYSGEPPYPECLDGMTNGEPEALAGAYLHLLTEIAGPADRIVDKLPFNFQRLGFITFLFPNARIVHCRRDVRDSGLSCYFQNFGEHMPWTNDLADLGHFIRLYQEIMDHWASVLPGRILELDYETLVTDPELQTRRLIDHLGLDWEDACLNFHQSTGAVQTASLWQVRQPIYTSSLERWRPYEDLLKPMLDELGI